MTKTLPRSAVTPFMTAAPDAPEKTFTSFPNAFIGCDSFIRVKITLHPRHFLQCTTPGSCPGPPPFGLGGLTPAGRGSRMHCSHVSQVSQVPSPSSSIFHSGDAACASGCFAEVISLLVRAFTPSQDTTAAAQRHSANAIRAVDRISRAR